MTLYKYYLFVKYLSLCRLCHGGCNRYNSLKTSRKRRRSRRSNRPPRNVWLKCLNFFTRSES